AKAITVDELKAQIASLQAQIAQLIAQLSQIQGNGSTAWCHNFNTNLGMGSSGSEVVGLERALIREGLRTSNDYGAGEFNEYIASAVTAFQEKYASEILKPYGLAHGTGYVGKSTRAKLNKIYGCGNGNGGGERACTMEAKQCPDGSYVGRSGPSCEFTACLTTLAPLPCGQYGDVNQNGYVTKEDSDLILNYVAGKAYPASDQVENADVSGDGSVASNDASLVLQYIAGTIKTFPACTRTLKVLLPNNKEIWNEAGNGSLLSSDTCSLLHCEHIEWSGGSGTDWRSVTAYLEQWINNSLKIVGKIPSYGYGSIVWPVGVIVPTSCTSDTFPGLYNCTKTLVGPGQYYVRLVDKITGETDRGDTYFTIASSTLGVKSVKVLSPNGGENWEAGKKYTIKWQTEGVGTDQMMQIDIYKCSNGTCTQQLPHLSVYNNTAGSYDYDIPNTYSGQYKFSVGFVTSDYKTYSDFSDNYFTISAPSTLPDFAVTDFSWIPTDNSSIKNFTVSVKNVGTVDSFIPAGQIMYIYKNSVSPSNIIDSFPHNGTTQVGVGQVQKFGLMADNLNMAEIPSFIVVFDPLDLVKESNEGNNTLSKTAVYNAQSEDVIRTQ
ncbi:MAG: dockerin type I domain-containing protein, partial [bacterium]